ncbi:MAG TPA: hypothetical protein PKM58_02835 [Pyrinomonadaceae bacterium]|nr:hypothetical protein [Pyrinomonadaceae bacterium]
MLNKDFREFLESLNLRNVRYLLIGGYAVALHGHPRYTKDIDIWIERSDVNVANLLLALHDFGFGDVTITKSDLLEQGSIIQLGYPPNRVDIINSPDGVDFADCYDRLVEFEIEDVKIPVIGLDDLRRNKRASGRLQDLADLEALGT